MQAHNWIERVPVYEPGRPLDEVARELGFADVAGLLKLASNENELGPSPLALEAMRAAAVDMHRYPDGGCFHLRRRLAERLDVQPDNLIFGNGSNELIEFLGHVYLGPGAELVMSECAFVVYRLVAALFNGRAVQVPMRDFTHDLDGLLAAITPATRLVIVCNPNNPTGTANDPAAIDRFVGALPDHVLAVFDEAYFELMPDGTQPDVLRHVRAGRPNVIVLRTFSKAYGLAGLRVGYGVADAGLIKLLAHVRQPFNVNAMGQAAALAALEDTAHLERTRAMLEESRRFFADALPHLGLDYVPSVANFILIKTGRGRERFAALQRRGIVTRPMDGYGLPDWLRITFGTPEQNRAVIAALEATLGS